MDNGLDPVIQIDFGYRFRKYKRTKSGRNFTVEIQPSQRQDNQLYGKMKSMIFFGLLCACAALPQSYTPEVQAERQRFFQLFNQAAAAAAAAPDIAVYPQHGGQYQPNQHQSSHRFAPQPAHAPVQTPKWTGPLASNIPAGLPGSVPQVGNTAEVEAAIAEFSRAYSAAIASTQPKSPAHYNAAQYNSAQYNPVQHREPVQPRWTGPFASDIPAGLPGSPPQVADTAEVQAAKAAFSRAFHSQLG